MSDFIQNGVITTLHDLGTISRDHLESLLALVTRRYKLGLVLPVTASDMRAEPFKRIVRELEGVSYVEQIVVVLGVAPEVQDYVETRACVQPLGEKTCVLWTDGPRLQRLYETLKSAGLKLSGAGKGRSVWTAFGYLMANPRLRAYILHDCDIVNYDREMLARLCLPMADPSLDFEFCKAYYVRRTDRMYGRVARLLMTPLILRLDLHARSYPLPRLLGQLPLSAFRRICHHGHAGPLQPNTQRLGAGSRNPGRSVSQYFDPTRVPGRSLPGVRA